MDKLAAAPTRTQPLPSEGNPSIHPRHRPLYRHIADELRAEIGSGRLLPGDPLPSENELMRRYGVSRGTVRQARADLRADGTIGGSQGRLFAVNAIPLTQPFGELVSFTAWARGLGKSPTGRVVSFAETTAEPDVAVDLGVAAGAAVFCLVRVRLVDGEPVMIERTIFPDEIGRLLEGVDLTTGSVYAELGRRGVEVASARHLVDAVPATASDTRLLGIATGTALLRVRRTAFSPAGAPIEYADDRYRGDRINFAIENDAAAVGIARRLA